MTEVQGEKITRKDFIRGLPMDMPAKDVIKQAKVAGITLKPHDVYTTRYAIRQEDKHTAPRRRGRPPNAASSSKSNSEISVLPTGKSRSLIMAARKERFLTLDVEQQLEVLVTRVGTERTRQLVEKIERQLTAV